MARNCADERCENSNSEEEEEEEEALSLCDLPVCLMNEPNQSRNEEEAKDFQTEEDFDFGSWAGSLLTESEMCAADEVFFQGQILPLRLSVSSDSCFPGSRRDRRNVSPCNSRSESMDHRYSGGFSSRSSSMSSTSTTTTTKYKPRIRNQFHSHPSPKPQIRVSGIRRQNAGCRSRQSTMWDLFRLGLVRTPEIELQDLKLRSNATTNKNFGSRNSNSTSSSNSSGSSKFSKINGGNDGDQSNHDPNMKKNKKQRFFTKESALLSGCKCSADAVLETVSSKIVIMKSGNRSGHNETGTHAIKEKLQQMTKQTTRQQQGKQAVSRHRTFEWLKELSLEAELDHEV